MRSLAKLFFVAASLLTVTPAFAQTRATQAVVPVASTPDTIKSAAPFDAPVVDADTLSTVTGKADLAMVISAKNTSNVSNNSVSGNSVTGSIAFDASSFSGLNGLSLLSANTGNNVAINSSLNVNVAIRP